VCFSDMGLVVGVPLTIRMRGFHVAYFYLKSSNRVFFQGFEP